MGFRLFAPCDPPIARRADKLLREFNDPVVVVDRLLEPRLPTVARNASVPEQKQLAAGLCLVRLEEFDRRVPACCVAWEEKIEGRSDSDSISLFLFLPLARAEGNYIILKNGQKITDASGGAAVGCIRWGNERVAQAIMDQTFKAPYCASIFYTTEVQERLCRHLVDSTEGHMVRAYIVSSG